MELLELIPDEPNAIGLIRVGPWWSLLHWLVQSTTVLMLEITFRANHMPEEVDAMMESSKKAIRWLHALGEDSQSAKRAWNICFPMLREATKKVGRDLTDVPQQPPGKPSPPPSDGIMSDITNYPYGVDLFTTAPNVGSLYATMPQTVRPLPTSQAFSMYDPMMQYDQYYPPEYQVNDMQYHQSGDPEIEFMSSAYHDHQDHAQGGGGSRGPGYS